MRGHHIILSACFGIALFIALGAMTFPKTNEPNTLATTLDDNTPLWDIMKKLGATTTSDLKKMDAATVERGKELVHKGYTTGANGKRTKQQSKFSVCTTCHNVSKEFENPADLSPEKRLDFAIQNKVPFLQASSFYGIVNRKTYYNDDYQKKYAGTAGIKEANTDIRAAIQFCAKNCSQGREFADWEVESILAYFWTLQYKTGDLKLADSEKQLVKNAVDKGEEKAKALQLLESKYAAYSPAHFAPIPKFKAPSEADANNTENQKIGKAIYEQACLHCHYNKKYSFFNLDNERLTFKTMESTTRKESYIFSMYYLVREGLAPRMGHRFYMPEFSIEKMSEKQLENLYIYVQAMAKGKVVN